MGFVKEFKDFAMRGNLIDMAVAVVMGAGFGKIITAFVDGMVMPVIGKLILNIDFSKYKLILQHEVKEGDIINVPEVAVHFGNFITQMLDFTIVAFAMFLVVKAINTLKKEAAVTGKPKPTLKAYSSSGVLFKAK